MYRVEITANSLEELADKALALGGKLANVSAAPVAAAPAKVEPTYAPPAEVVEVNPVAAAVPEAPAPEVVIPDYDTVVGPAVLALVEAKGKPAAKAVLSRYNAGKAAEVPKEQWAKLVAELNAARGA